jgi:DUF438 domain-containing protein
MSELINNREFRQKTIKEIIKQLHEGKSMEEVKQLFADAFEGVSALEISEAEGALIKEGLPIAEIQSLCDVHAAVFKGSIEEIHQEMDPTKIPGHPLNTLVRENQVIEKIIEKEVENQLLNLEKGGDVQELQAGMNHLGQLHIHYLKKENLLFPYMEQYGITAPPKVMWGVDDEIRNKLKDVKARLIDPSSDMLAIAQKGKELITQIREMIFKEENLMIPMLVEKLTQDEWKLIADESGELGFLVDKVAVWEPNKEAKENLKEAEAEAEAKDKGIIKLPSGFFDVKQLTSLLNTLPMDITFVNKDDIVQYYSEAKERIFPRTKAIIGRNVSNCHPPASVHVVEQIVNDFKAGKKDHEDFWIRMGDKFILIRYYAVRDEKGEYLGVLEVTQNIKPIQEITGEKRLL